MISIVYCTRESNPAHKEHLISSSGLHKHIEVIEIINNGESLTKAYNRGLNQAKNDIVVFCHDDITLETKQWGHKLLKLFAKNQDYGIIGVAGTKFLSTSGQWWENRKKMYGRVAHTHEGKTWLSSYSDDLGQNLEEVVTVDGVFFAVDKRKLQSNFNENYEGFHFYDVTFCFENFTKGVKVGVTTVIRVNHKSIGMTNESWEANRVKFSEEYKEHLPANVKKSFNKNTRLKVLIGCLNFNGYTGSELYVFELAKELTKQNCEVHVCSNIGNPLVGLAKQYGIKLHTLQEPPGFKLGDGQWKLKSAQGEVVSQPNTLYKLSDINFDIIHLNHKPVTEHLLRLYPDVPVICSIHSEVIALEHPVISDQIKKYVAIRPEIKEFLVEQFNIEPSKIEVIYNPIDASRFRPTNSGVKNKKPKVLFVGTIDYLRRAAIEDLIETTKAEGKDLMIVGKKNDTYLDALLENNPHVKYHGATNDVEKFVKECDETAGILLGRTTIEGWMCGKKGWIYDVDNVGAVISKKLCDIPEDVDKFKSDIVAGKIIEQYTSVL